MRPPRLTRRHFLAASGATLAWAALPPVKAWAKADEALRLSAGKATFSLEPYGPAEVGGCWGFNGTVPGPVIRVKQGERLRAVLENALAEDTTIHWHGIRLPNAMDGVPHLTQAPVAPGGRFEYDFTLPDAGTYWYHPHANAPEQLGRGLSGALIVEEAEPYPADREILWLLDDWMLDRDANLVGGFDDMHARSHDGRIGNTVTINGRLQDDEPVRPGERIRLRIINAANGRIFRLKFGDLPAHVIALDGQPVAPFEAGRVTLGPGMRADVVLDIAASAETGIDVIDDFYAPAAFRLITLQVAGEPARAAPLDSVPPALPANPVPEPDLADAVNHEIEFKGGMMGSLPRDEMIGLMRQGMAWTVNGQPHAPDAHRHEAPLFTVKRDATCRLTLINDTRWFHPIHLHGHHFRVLTRDGQPEPHLPLRDTVLMGPQERVEIAFKADNPGDWMIHCHVLEHHAGGMGGVFRVQA